MLQTEVTAFYAERLMLPREIYRGGLMQQREIDV
jgi:hypothetical protein